MFENKNYEGIYYSRFVASYTNKGGKTDWKFKEWLKELVINGNQIPEEVIKEIYDYATNGKLELEMNAEAFLKVHSKTGTGTIFDMM